MLGRPDNMTPEELRRWASEHLMYEVDSLIYATVSLNGVTDSRLGNAFLESFAVHARCLNNFLWHDRKKPLIRDAFASDFCSSGAWEARRKALPQHALEDVRRRKRFGREVMHLTYDRIDGEGDPEGDAKEWPCGQVLVELANALSVFGQIALEDQLGKETRQTLSSLLANNETTVAFNSAIGATDIRLGQIHQVAGGTIHVHDVWNEEVGS